MPLWWRLLFELFYLAPGTVLLVCSTEIKGQNLQPSSIPGHTVPSSLPMRNFHLIKLNCPENGTVPRQHPTHLTLGVTLARMAPHYQLQGPQETWSRPLGWGLGMWACPQRVEPLLTSGQLSPSQKNMGECVFLSQPPVFMGSWEGGMLPSTECGRSKDPRETCFSGVHAVTAADTQDSPPRRDRVLAPDHAPAHQALY